MKKVVFPALIVLTALFVSCKETPETPQVTSQTEDLAIAKVPETAPESAFLYVTSKTGLSLREYNNLSSDKLAVMPYGTKIKILTPEDKATMTVGGIKGGMNEVEYNHKKGFAFNGYLSKFFPPESDIKAAIYAEDLQNVFPAVTFLETTGGTASKPSTTETLVLPTIQWHEAFYIAKALYNLPQAFTFPNPKGKDLQIIDNTKKTPTLWVSQLEVTRKDNTLQKVVYNYAGKGYKTAVSITPEGDTMKIEKTEVIE